MAQREIDARKREEEVQKAIADELVRLIKPSKNKKDNLTPEPSSGIPDINPEDIPNPTPK